MIKETFIPFGSQYYRAPTPAAKNWRKDIEAISQSGLNTIKIWIQWRWNQPGENSFYFEDIDRLMELAFENGLKVIPNLIFDTAPAWYYRKHPDSVMITADGRRVEPVATAWRQTGGAPGPCYNHPAAAAAKDRFLEETISRYCNHPALYMWDLWNEPELTCGILREPLQGNMVCYCPHCEAAFKSWLRKKYGEVIQLNQAWQRNYREWEDIELPRRGDTFNDMIDWREFFAYTLTGDLRRRVETTKRIDKKTPVMIHSETIPEFNTVFSCNNDYDMAELCDVYGSSNGNWPFSSAFFTSCSGGRRVINAEIYLSWGGTYDRPVPLTLDEVKANIFIPLAKGIKGFISWQYRPEALGQEAPAWGLVKPDGSATPLLGYYTTLCKALQQNARLIEQSRPQPSTVAILNSSRAQTFDWCVSGSVDIYTNSIIGAFSAFHDANINTDIISMEKLTLDQLLKYRLVYCPFPYYMEEKSAKLLESWVKDGGFLVAEAFFGTVSAETSLHNEIVPGYNFDRIFGVREKKASTSVYFGQASDKSTLGDRTALAEEAPVEDEDTPGGPVSASLINKDALQSSVPFILETDFGILDQGSLVEGYCFAEELEGNCSSIIGKFRNGSAACTLNNYGNGKAVLAGTLLGYAYSRGASENLLEFMKNLARMAGAAGLLDIKGGRVRADLLQSDLGEALLIINSLEDKNINAILSITTQDRTWSKAINIVDGSVLEFKPAACGCSLELEVPSGSHEAYRLE